MASRARGWRQCGCYVWRTRKPSAVVGLSSKWLAGAAGVLSLAMLIDGAGWWALLPAVLPLFSGRHVAYVGETGSRYFRDRQHAFGDARYGVGPKSWSDLEPKCYPLPCLFPHVMWARRLQEKLWILLLLPVYNTEWNTKNPRRVTSTKAQQQRWARDKLRKNTAGLVKFNVLPALARGALMLAVFAGGIYWGWEAWF